MKTMTSIFSAKCTVDDGNVEAKARAATLIQSSWKGRNTRKKFAFKQLPEIQMTKSHTFLVGNDPKITGLEPYASVSGEKVALIGTSGLRALALVCKLGNREALPKLIIVDNSKQVIKFWRNLREMVAKDVYHSNDEFLQKFQEFFEQNKALCRILSNDAFTCLNAGALEYENQDPVLFLSQLIGAFGLHYVCMIIKSSVIIGQSWADTTLFSSLKNILKLNGIDKTYIYPSNIPSVIDDEDLDSFFANIQIIAPHLSIITDLCPTHRQPEQTILTTETNPSQLKRLIFPDDAHSASRAAKNWGFPLQGQVVIVPMSRDTLLLLSLLMHEANQNNVYSNSCSL